MKWGQGIASGHRVELDRKRASGVLQYKLRVL